MSWRDKITAEEGLKAAIAAHKALGRRDTTSDNNVVAQNILEGDLGYFRDAGIAQYDLDEEARDRLIAHARQDAALAVLNSASLLAEVARMRRRQRITMVLLLVVVGLLVWSGR